MSKRILILGANGFIGHHLSARILAETDWHVYGMDLAGDRLEAALESPRFHFVEGDITISREWIEYQVKRADVVLPLVAIATPATYVTDPIAVFELDFEANLPIVRHCVTYGKRLVFPSTSEVYGMCEDIRLVDGGRQRRTFTDVRDGTDALLRILENRGGKASGKIYNVGNPANDCSIRDLAEHMLGIACENTELRERASRIRLLDVPAEEYYGEGYQDILTRVPRIDNTIADLGWKPVTGLDDTLRGMFDSYRGVHAAREFVDARS